MTKPDSKREHVTNVRKLANTYARSFNTIAERAGHDLPMPLILKLIDLFNDAIDTGEALAKSESFEVARLDGEAQP